MAAYFVFGLTRPKSVRNSERFADNLYFLGFILTLGALFRAMTPWFSDLGQITSRTIIEQFGIAISTTFLGMSLRTILIQLRHTVTDQEEEARESIAKYVVNLNQEIGTAISDISEFRKEAAQTASESLREVGSQMANVA